MSPIAKRDKDGQIDSEHAIAFDASANVQHLDHIFRYYHVNMRQCSV